MLKTWFVGTDKLRRRTAVAHLQALVLTDTYREELAALIWANVDFQCKKLTITDKVDATRVIALTPCMAWPIHRTRPGHVHVHADDGDGAPVARSAVSADRRPFQMSGASMDATRTVLNECLAGRATPDDLIARAGVEARRQRSAGEFGSLVFLDAPGPL